MRPLAWDAAMQAQLVELASVPGTSWTVIAAAMGISRNAVIMRAMKTGVRRGRAPIVSGVAAAANRGRDALPPGSPETWGLIVAGTVLAGEPYPGGEWS